jgi:hypothetical protein
MCQGNNAVRTEKENMLAGDLYDPFDMELAEAKAREQSG